MRSSSTSRDLTYGFYAPSPGVIYPTLTYLEEAGYVVAEQEGNKKRYAITAEGQEHLDQNRSFAMTILDRLSQLAERMRQKQERRGRDEGPAVPRSVDARAAESEGSHRAQAGGR
jgi:DNA-binding PadR family transcriptional regulator